MVDGNPGAAALHFVEVPPPDAAPVHSRARELGLPDGLRVEVSGYQWRCASCNEMQPNGSEQVWVPASVRSKDPAWSVTEAARLNAWNGDFSAWCVHCASGFQQKHRPPKKPHPGSGAAQAPLLVSAPSWLGRLWDWLCRC